MRYDFENKPRRSFFGLGFWVIVIVVGLSAVGGALTFGTSLLSQPARIVQQTFDANNVINNYEWFKQQHNDILAMDVKIANAENQKAIWLESAPPRDQWATQDRQMFNQLSSITLGLANQRAAMVSTYNSRAEMANRSIFMQGVPSHIE